MNKTLLFLIPLFFFACKKDDSPTPEPSNAPIYFPPISGSEWKDTSMVEMDWDTSKISSFYDFLIDNNTRAFIVLKDGKICMEQYWGNDVLNKPFGQESLWYWASAGKTITSILVGKAQEDGYLNIDDASSKYLGDSWTSMELEKEQNIKIRHQLTMTTGLDYVGQFDCTDPSCLKYKKDPGTQWYYHNAPYTLLTSVVPAATGVEYNAYTDQILENTIGMEGYWLKNGENNVYWSRPRDAARFGLMILNNGNWNGTDILTDKDYFKAMVNTSQDLNPSYGYLWWLNGKGKVIYPSLPTAFNADLAKDAPKDLIAAMGKNGQYVCVVPSENLVLIRMGESPDNALVPTIFHNDMWAKLMEIIP